jgi:hypothetical protein
MRSLDVWMDPDTTKRIDYLRLKHGFRGAAHFYSGYAMLDISPQGWLSPPFGTAGPKKRGIGEAKAVMRRLRSGRSVSRPLLRWALNEWRECVEDRVRDSFEYDY